jgi:Flp pilus assembly protein TadD
MHPSRPARSERETKKFRGLLALVLMATGLLSPARATDELAEVMQLRQQGQFAAALTKADQFLSSHPRDAQMRFAKAAILAETKRAPEAISAFESLTQDFPDLAEPYNNLAALHANAGDYPKARAALEQALRLKPGYAIAHENLGDLYAALAAQAYATALKLDPTLAGLEGKLAQVRQLTKPAASASAGAASR